MTEQEWLASTEAGEMVCWYLDNVKEITDRQARLLICGCVRRVRLRLMEDQWMRAVEVGERFAERLASEDELLAVYDPLAVMRGRTVVEQAAINTAASACSPIADLWYTLGGVWGDAQQVYQEVARREAEGNGQATMVRDVLGNPFYPGSLAPGWLTPPVRKLAQAAYDNRLLPSGLLDNAGLAILADALEEAGCDNADILSHLRGPGEHVRGCWVVDLLLGKD
jgi:hypothetical protein